MKIAEGSLEIQYPNQSRVIVQKQSSYRGQPFIDIATPDKGIKAFLLGTRDTI